MMANMSDTQKGIILATLLATVTIFGVNYLPLSAQYDFFFSFCSMLPSIYLGAALVNTSLSRVNNEILLELVGTFIWFSLAFYAKMHQSWFYFAIAYASHGLWDVWHSQNLIGRENAKSTKLPNWYPIGCAVFDVIIGAFLFTKM